MLALLPALEAWHQFLLKERDPLDDGAVALLHPWESGMDNAPRWDAALMRWEPPEELAFKRVDTSLGNPEERPHDHEYRRYAWLVEQVRRADFRQARAVERSPFLVEDVAFTAILAWAEEALLDLGRRLDCRVGSNERLSALKRGLEHLWTENGFRDFDIRVKQHVSQAGAWELVPLVAPISQSHTARMLERLDSEYRARWPIPTVPPCDSSFEPRRYWRGPTWVNVNWLVIRGLQRHGFHRQARLLAGRTLDLVETSGFREHFNPHTGQGGGAPDFTWTAALVLDLVMNPPP